MINLVGPQAFLPTENLMIYLVDPQVPEPQVRRAVQADQ
jgi:hypothetical protein